MHAFRTHSQINFLPIPVPRLGAWIQNRRLTIGYHLKKASALTGISRHEWELLELGNVPTTENENFLRALAGTLEIRFDDLVCVIAPLEAHLANSQDQSSVDHNQADHQAA